MVKHDSTSVSINSLLISIYSTLCTMNQWNNECQKNKNIILLQSQVTCSKLVWINCGHINLACRKPKICPVLCPPRRWNYNLGAPKLLHGKTYYSSGCRSANCHVTTALWRVKAKIWFYVFSSSLLRWEQCSLATFYILSVGRIPSPGGSPTKPRLQITSVEWGLSGNIRCVAAPSHTYISLQSTLAAIEV